MKVSSKGKFTTLAIVISMATLLVISVQAKEKLQYWAPWGGIWQEMQEKIMNEYNRTHPDNPAEYVHVTWQGFREKLATSVVAGTPPDVAVVFGHFNILPLAVQGVLQPLDELMAGDPVLNPDVIVPGAWKQNIWGGKMWGMCYVGAAAAMIYNKEVFKEVGLDPNKPPKTWDELDAMSAKIVKYDAKGKLERMALLPWGDVWGGYANWTYFMTGGQFYDPNTGKMTVDDPRNVEALQLMIDYIDKYGGLEAILGLSQAFGEQGIDPFIAGKLAMRFQHSWYLSSIHKFGPELDYGVAPIPQYGKPDPMKVPFFGSDGALIPKGGKRLKDAWEFFRWWITDGENIWAETQVMHTTRRGVRLKWPDWVVPGAWEVYSDAVAKARPAPAVPVYQLLSDRLSAEVDLALRKQKSPKEALQAVQVEVQKELDKILKKKL
ncbi:MAG: ABC transporter substrate-binding protein [bacterium]